MVSFVRKPHGRPTFDGANINFMGFFASHSTCLERGSGKVREAAATVRTKQPKVTHVKPSQALKSLHPLKENPASLQPIGVYQPTGNTLLSGISDFDGALPRVFTAIALLHQVLHAASKYVFFTLSNLSTIDLIQKKARILGIGRHRRNHTRGTIANEEMRGWSERAAGLPPGLSFKNVGPSCSADIRGDGAKQKEG